MKYLETKSVNPYYNLAFEDIVLSHRKTGDYLMLWQNDNTVVIGQNQCTAAEINADAIERYGVNVVRRSTGGGAVYHDLGNLNYSFITDEIEGDKTAFEKFTGPVVAALRNLGLIAETSGRNDILVDGKKVSGIAQRHLDGRILHHGTLLFCENLERAGEVLNVDPEKIKAKGVKSVRSRITNIGDYLPEMTLAEFWDYLKLELGGSGADAFVPSELSSEELAEVIKLQREKYETYEWNYGKSLHADITNKKRFPGGSVEIRLALEGNKIKDAQIVGDFLSLEPISELENSLLGIEYKKSAIADALPNNLSNYLGNISREEFLELM